MGGQILMQQIPLQAIPNQSFSITLDNNNWDIAIKTTNGCTSVSLTLNRVVVIENMRAVANTKIIPAEYEEAGNFAFVSKGQALPSYVDFDITQALLYITADDLAAIRVPIAPKITSPDFDSVAPLPLRFSPQGYVLAS